MNTITFLKTSLVLAVGFMLVGCASNGGFHDGSITKYNQANPANYHTAAMERHEARTEILEEKIQKLQKRITMFNQKPYHDPKGLRRGGWKLLKGMWQQEVNELRERIDWHVKELARLQTSSSCDGYPTWGQFEWLAAADTPDSEWPTERQPLSGKEICLDPVDSMDFDEPDSEWPTEEQPAFGPWKGSDIYVVNMEIGEAIEDHEEEEDLPDV